MASLQKQARGILLFLAFIALCSSVKATLFEPFDEDIEGRWLPSSLPQYEGKWKWAKGEDSDDYGILVTEKAKKFGIATKLSSPVEWKDKPLVLQYDVRLSKGLDCGGAYLKFLMPQEAGWSPSDLKEDTPYSIMFGPDRCGATNKVHFIFRHKSPQTGEYVEHHMRNPPFPQTFDKFSHCYTAVIHPNNTVHLLIDGELRTTADLLSQTDFTPPVLPPKTIPDKDDKKPEDWDERKTVQDPNATKPDDWDEDAPREIVDEEATKPEGWLDDEPLEVDDPAAVMPDDWDVEEDGEWEPPKVPNPKCEEAPGCGVWKKPLKKNPAFKGTWHAPMIDNPAYKGVWKPREVPNPDFFDLERPGIEPVEGVAVEIWTMSDGLLFDNVLVSDDVRQAEEVRQSRWQTKLEVEKAADKERTDREEEEMKRKKANEGAGIKNQVLATLFKYVRQLASLPALKAYHPQIESLLSVAEKEAGEHETAALGLLAVIALLPLAVLLSPLLMSSGKKAKVSVAQAKKEDISSPDDITTTTSSTSHADGNKDDDASASASTLREEADKSSAAEEIAGDDDNSGKPRRRTRRD